MPIPNSDHAFDPSPVTPSMGDRATDRETGMLLNELLAHSIRLRDLYKKARWQTTGLQFRQLRLMFETHYKEQLRLVDVLVDRIRMLRGGGRVFAGVFLQETRFSYPCRGRPAIVRILRDLIDAHESALGAAHSGAQRDVEDNPRPMRDFAVGQVVLTNDLQIWSIGEQLMRRDAKRRLFEPHCGGADT
jgi:starvation-inducible DNA-binding protein